MAEMYETIIIMIPLPVLVGHLGWLHSEDHLSIHHDYHQIWGKRMKEEKTEERVKRKGKKRMSIIKRGNASKKKEKKVRKGKMEIW